jgi:hypothetical protein
MKLKTVFLFLYLIFSQAILAADFIKINIPEAKCGNGEGYSVYVKKQSDQKLLIEFMGGGACWNFESCFTQPKTSLSPISSSGPFSTLTTNDPSNPFYEHSMLYIPYCTGDVHIGNHIASYNGKTVYHYGNKNLELALNYLRKEKQIDLGAFSNVTIWGASAGAIGSFIQSSKIEKFLDSNSKKTLIPDSPGLHFGERFWDKFSPETKLDFYDALTSLGVVPDFNDGFIAKKLRPALALYDRWNIGFLISTKDAVMSTIFGDINPLDHEKLVLSSEGLPAIAREFSNVSIWLQNSAQHTFLVSSKSSQTESVDNIKAIDFARELAE